MLFISFQLLVFSFFFKPIGLKRYSRRARFRARRSAGGGGDNREASGPTEVVAQRLAHEFGAAALLGFAGTFDLFRHRHGQRDGDSPCFLAGASAGIVQYATILRKPCAPILAFGNAVHDEVCFYGDSSPASGVFTQGAPQDPLDIITSDIDWSHGKAQPVLNHLVASFMDRRAVSLRMYRLIKPLEHVFPLFVAVAAACCSAHPGFNAGRPLRLWGWCREICRR